MKNIVQDCLVVFLTILGQEIKVTKLPTKSVSMLENTLTNVSLPETEALKPQLSPNNLMFIFTIICFIS